SAEAAKEIKGIVEQASSKAQAGKQISTKMIEGYDELNDNIKNTIEMIENVANASKEQERGIIQINDAVAALDKSTQENATVADRISNMSEQIAQMSNSLVTAASRASFLEDSRNEVCDIDLVYDTAKLKVNILQLKDSIFSKFGNFENFNAEANKSTQIWLDEFLKTHPDCNMQTVTLLSNLNKELTTKLQVLINANHQKESNTTLNEKAKEVEDCSLLIFSTLNKLKKEVCKQ
ncbi:MAG: methyl-accepting chemotaxis protein, partial [Arcobacteraceae bacterium]